MAKATREAYGEALKRLAVDNPDIVVLDADLSGSTKTSEFKKVSPERFFNVGIAEQNLIGTAAGLALAGKIPFASSFAMFAAGRAFEIIRNTVAYPGLNVKIAATHAGLSVGEDGGSHQAIEDISLMRSIPNMTVISPADGREAEQAVLRAAEYVGPVYIRLGRMAVEDVYDDSYVFELGKGVLLRDGKDAASWLCGCNPSIGVISTTKLHVFEKGVHFAPSPHMSITPSWNPTISPTVTTAAPYSTFTFPSPNCSVLDVTPAKPCPFPSIFTLGSITSLTGIILTFSPGLAMSTFTSLTLSSSLSLSINSWEFTIKVPLFTCVLFPNCMSLI
jgi:hypothetical protein